MAVAVGAGAMLFVGMLGTVGAAPALAAPQQTHAAPVAEQAQVKATYSRKVWKTVNHRVSAHGDSTLIGKLYANTYYTVSCWRTGESVTAEGTTNNVWIYAKNSNGRWGYASAIYFSGNKYADLPLSARC
ncbi:hypothetical protein [Streptomyces candidus]|uniref:SH3 domain-containing protein n=1 Tax=Streptomyces candidus TaxID=67283 RepID=A0A7X0LQT1_9ACTN|nr:hypothetical protein [Streptomyces candidus]MBB6437923.1 hypothetical protein [Streptomyces candidus]